MRRLSFIIACLFYVSTLQAATIDRLFQRDLWWGDPTTLYTSPAGRTGYPIDNTYQLQPYYLDVRTLGTALTGASIQAAIDNTANQARKIILQRNATYTISSSVTLDNNLTLDLNGSTITLANSFNSVAFIVSGDNVTITNGVIDGNRANQTRVPYSDTWDGHTDAAIFRGATAYKNFRVENVTVKNTIQTAIAIQGVWEDVYIAGNRFQNIGDIAFYQNCDASNLGMKRARIIGNVFDNVGSGLAGPTPATVKGWGSVIVTTFDNNTIIANNIFDTWMDRDAVKFQRPTNAVFTGNTLRNGSSGVQAQWYGEDLNGLDISNNVFDSLLFGVIYIEGTTGRFSGVNVSSNTIRNYATYPTASGNASVPRNGIYVEGTTGAIIANNVIRGGEECGTAAIILYDDNNILVSGNVIDDVDCIGIYMNYDIVNSTISGNAIRDTLVAGIQWGEGINDLATNARNRIVNNTIIDPGSNNAIYVLGSGDSIMADVSMNTYYGGKMNFTGDNSVLRNNIGFGNYTQAYSGNNNYFYGNGYFDAGNDFVPSASGFSELWQSPAFAASYTPDLSLGNHINVGTLTDNVTINAPTNSILGQRLSFFFLQDGTGGRTVTWNATYKVSWSDTGNTANKRAAVEFYYNGSNWLQVGGQVVWY